jgi:ribosomal-protein-alanine N-acetyltransferase
MLLDANPLLLRPFRLEDVDRAFALSNEPSARRWLPSQVYTDPDHARASIQFLIDSFSDPADPRRGPFVFAVEHAASQALIGHVGLSPFEDGVEVGFGMAEAYQGQGFAVLAVSAACRWALPRFNLTSVVGSADDDNQASQKVLQRAGFVHGERRTIDFQGMPTAVSTYSFRLT